MIAGILFLAGLAAESVVLLVSMLLAFRERRAFESYAFELAKSVRGKTKSEREPSGLPAEVRGAAEKIDQALRSGSDLDRALTESLTEVAQARLRRGAVWSIALDALLAMLALGPMLVALGTSAARMTALFALTQQVRGARLYAAGLEELPRAFGPLRDGFEASAVLGAGLALVWTARWWLRRPEVREARLIEAMVRAAIGGKPGTAAPVGARLATLLAPTISLAGPIKAALGFLVMVTAAWWLLTSTADLRRANTAPVAPREIWAKSRFVSTLSDELQLPSRPAGSLPPSAPSLIISPRALSLASAPEVPFEDGALPKDWKVRIKELEQVLAPFRTSGRPLQMAVLAHRELPVGTVLQVLQAVRTAFNAGSFALILVRPMFAEGRDHPIQASLDLGFDSAPVAVRLSIQPQEVQVSPRAGGAPVGVSFRADDWQDKLRAEVRAATGMTAVSTGEPDLRVGVTADPALSWDRMIEVLSAADTTCEGAVDCGLPGLGLSFVWLEP